jgi:hypothetical protein
MALLVYIFLAVISILKRDGKRKDSKLKGD